jgi:hypothetical protein
MVALRVLEAIAPLRVAGLVEVGRVAVHQLPAGERELRQKAVGTAVDLLHRVVAVEASQRPLIAIDADVAQRRRLALHDRPAA